MPSTERNDLTADFVRSILDYDPETGIFRWRFRKDMPQRRNTRHAGKAAGYVNPDGYIHIRVAKGALYLAHRLAWLYVTGEWPKEHIDHKNGDMKDNRFANLREATRAQNMHNMKKHADNQSGFLGVRFRPHHGKWEARITRNYEIVWHAYFPDAQSAAAARRVKLVEIDGEFASRDA